MNNGAYILAVADGLVTLVVIVLLSAVSSWLQKKRGQPDEPDMPSEPGAPPPLQPRRRAIPPQSVPPVPQSGWEESLRRLLQESAPQRPQPAPAPPTLQPMPAGQRPRLPVATRAPARVPVPAQKEGPAKQAAQLNRADATFDRARNLREKIASRFRAIERVQSKPALRSGETNRTTSKEITQVVALLRDRKRARQGIIAGIVLGPPKALDQSR